MSSRSREGQEHIQVPGRIQVSGQGHSSALHLCRPDKHGPGVEWREDCEEETPRQWHAVAGVFPSLGLLSKFGVSASRSFWHFYPFSCFALNSER